MPSTSPKQARYMAMMAHNPMMARKQGVSQGVAKEFNEADSRSGMLSRALKARKMKELKK